MQFTFANVDMDGGLGNPPIAVAVALAALVFAAWMVSVLRSQQRPLRKGLMLGAIFALAFPGARLAEFLGRLYLVARHSRPNVDIGFIGHPPGYVAPAAAVFLALTFLGGSALWRHFRAPVTP